MHFIIKPGSKGVKIEFKYHDNIVLENSLIYDEDTKPYSEFENSILSD